MNNKFKNFQSTMRTTQEEKNEQNFSNSSQY